MYIWEISREKLVTVEGDLEFILKYHCQLKSKKKLWEASYGEVTRESTVHNRLLCRFKSVPC